MTASNALLRVGLLSAGIALTFLPRSLSAQEMDHSKMQMPMPTEKHAPAEPPVRKKTVPKAATQPAPAGANAGHGASPAPEKDHSAMDHNQAMPAATSEPMDHAAMGHDMPMLEQDANTSMQGMDHGAMGHPPQAAPTQPRTPIPPVTEADRAAAIPPPSNHPAHDNSIQRYVLLNRLEAWDADPDTGMAWEGQAWIGTDRNRLWLRSEGERTDGRTEAADLEVLYGRSIATWWDVVAGVRHDFKPGDSQSFAVIGVQGLAPQKFEVEATAYLGERGQTAARFEAEYELLLTNRLILQPLVEVNLFGKDDPARGIGSGLSTAEAGLRLRYEFTRQFAPYIGLVYERAFGGTAELRRDEFERVDDTRIVVGIRTWF